jgi:hypothetical protein
MSESGAPLPTPGEENDRDEALPLPPDGLLELLVGFADSGGLTARITLWVSGALVSGTLVGVTAYYHGIATEAEFLTGGENALSKALRQIGGSVEKRVEADQAGERERLISYIHLKDARTFAPGGRPLPANRGVWWRGRLESVDGWCIGGLPAEEA